MLKRVEKVMAALSRLPDLEDSQFETTLLYRSCLALPKVAFSLRCCPPSHINDAISVFDDAMRDTLGAIAGGSIPDWAWLKGLTPQFTWRPHHPENLPTFPSSLSQFTRTVQRLGCQDHGGCPRVLAAPDKLGLCIS